MNGLYDLMKEIEGKPKNQQLIEEVWENDEWEEWDDEVGGQNEGINGSNQCFITHN